MMNYIYSVLKKANSISRRYSKSSIRLVIIIVFNYVLIAFTGLLMFEKILFDQANKAFEIFIGIVAAFIIVFPISYSFYPGYKYLDSVKKYSNKKAILISILIALLPIALLMIMINAR